MSIEMLVKAGVPAHTVVTAIASPDQVPTTYRLVKEHGLKVDLTIGCFIVVLIHTFGGL